MHLEKNATSISNRGDNFPIVLMLRRAENTR